MHKKDTVQSLKFYAMALHRNGSCIPLALVLQSGD